MTAASRRQSAQRQLREEGVPGALEADQPQGRLPGRVRLRELIEQVRRRAGQAAAGHAAAVHRPGRRADRRPSKPTSSPAGDGVRGQPRRRPTRGTRLRSQRQVRPARQDRREDPADPAHGGGHPRQVSQPGDVRAVQAEPRALHRRGRPAHQRAEGHGDHRAPDLRHDRRAATTSISSPRTRPSRTSPRPGRS